MVFDSIRESLHRLSVGLPLGRGLLSCTLKELAETHPESTRDILLSAFLTGLMVRGPSEDDIVELVEAALSMDRAPGVRLDCGGVPPLLVVAGSGKKGVRIINVSTPSCLVAASAGARVVKVGSAATSSLLGSWDLVKRLKISEANGPEDALASVRRHGFAFVSIEDQLPQVDRIYGGRFHAVNPFSFALPVLACPVRGDLIVYGLSHPRVDLAARVLARFGVRDAVIVTSRTVEGFFVDEVGIGVESLVCETRGGNTGRVETLSVAGHLRRSLDRMPLPTPSTPAQAYAWAVEALSGRGSQSHIEIIALNAAHLLVLSGIAPSLEQGYQEAWDVIHSGLALKKINDIQVGVEQHGKEESTL